MARVKKGYNDLASQNPQLALQWNYKKNIGVTPSDVAINSNKKYWWICEKGHEWEANVNSRNRGNGCPVCSNRIILKGYNDLASQNPELADEWNYERNTKSPEEVCYKSNDRFWWKCKTCHNEWQTSLYDRYKGTGCPYCSGRRPVKGINDIATTNPELIPEWDIEKNKNLTPYDVSAGSSRKVWWKCKFGHEWRTLVSVRAKYHTGCPTCAKNLKTSFPEQALYYYISKLFSDAVNGYKELGRELDIYIPSISVAIEYDGWVWHNLKSSVRNDELKNRICRENGIKLIRIREEGCIELEEDDNVLTVRCKANDNSSLEEGIKEILKILNVSSDVDIEKDRNNIMEQYLTAYRNNSLEYRYPEVAKEWNYEKNGNITPDMVNAGTSKQFWWICPRGHEYKSRVAHRTGKKVGCPYCSGHKVIVGETDLATVNPELAKEWHPVKNGTLLPSEVKPYSNKKVWWIGKCGHEWIAPPCDRMNGNGCPYCANQSIR